MEKFIVSARKYRPQDFATVIGQQHITTTLKNAIQNNTLAHAFLFCGPRGVGKTTCARILAKTINCEKLQPNSEACNTCTSCVSFNNGSSLNIHELDAASNNSVDDIRELVNQVRFTPQHGKYKIYIIDEVHMLSPSAFNAFLKTLEEPPSYAKFILATTEKHKIIPTILSRCQIFDFKRITTADTVIHLQEIAQKEHIEADKASLQLIAQKSEGCMRDSLSLLDKIVSFSGGNLSYSSTLEHLNLLDEDYYFKLLDAIKEEDLTTTLLLLDEILAKGFEGETVLGGLAECVRNLMVCKDPKAAKLLDVVEGLHERYVQMAKQLSMSFLVTGLSTIADGEMQYRQSRNKRLSVELVLIKLCYLQQAITVASEDGAQVIKKRAIDGPVRQRTILRETPIINYKAQSKAATLVIETTSKPEKNAVLDYSTATVVPALTNEEGNSFMVKKEVATKVAPFTKPSTGGLISKLKAKHLQNIEGQKEKIKRPLVLDEVYELWKKVADDKRDEAKFSIAGSVERAVLAQTEADVIEITCASVFDMKVVELTTTDFLATLKEFFDNDNIKLKCIVDDDAYEQPDLPLKFMPTKHKFMVMAQKFPLVQELKDKLSLQIES